jgi:hypothetical protein
MQIRKWGEMSENQNVVELAKLASEFHRAVENKIGGDQEAQKKVNDQIKPEEVNELQSTLQELAIEAAMIAKQAKNFEEVEAKMATKVIRLVDMFTNIAKYAYSEDELAQEMPAGAKGQEKSDAFKAQGANNIAAICLK